MVRLFRHRSAERLVWPAPCAPKRRQGKQPLMSVAKPRQLPDNRLSDNAVSWQAEHQAWLEQIQQSQLSVFSHTYQPMEQHNPPPYILWVLGKQPCTHTLSQAVMTYAKSVNCVIYLMVESQDSGESHAQLARHQRTCRLASDEVYWLDEFADKGRWLRDAQIIITDQWLSTIEAAIYRKPVMVYGQVAQRLQAWIQPSTATESLHKIEWHDWQQQQLLLATWFSQHCHVWHPEWQQSCSVSQAIAWLEVQFSARRRLPAKVGFLAVKRFWRASFNAFFQGCQRQFVAQPEGLTAGVVPVLWGNRTQLAQDFQQVLRVEDGFLRSVGLGALFTRPLSWVVDDLGLYFDATRPSRLEHFLQHHVFTQRDCQQAEQLQQQLLRANVTKYNTGQGDWQPVNSEQPIILVVGQVENDASIEFGSPIIKSNIELLRQVRRENPQAYLLYKPHPDVVAGARASGKNESQAHQWCDQVITHIGIDQLYPHVDEVHVISSLAGFEALLRHKKVVCYGQPFYSGWGLTLDKAPMARRTRQLTLNELIFASLIWYPLYISPVTGYYCSASQTVEHLQQWKNSRSPRLAKLKVVGAKWVRTLIGIR
ncbi:hypothetical protein [Vibrio metschnikovii]|uniref:capsular polysaccharide export protein, LipB/KpsS family n=1 Tax=Vibrio metschnikovii TaxID=28172 RepID=UPI001C303AED|nr:hypothetical protein [Vibrio metschnikovii]